MNVNVYTTLNGVEFNQMNDIEEFERVSKLLKLIKAPDFVQPSKSFIQLLRNNVMDDTKYLLLYHACDDDYTRVINNFDKALCSLEDEDDVLMQIYVSTQVQCIGKPFELDLNQDQKDFLIFTALKRGYLHNRDIV